MYLGPIICTSLRFFPPDLCSRLPVTFFHLGCYQGLNSMQGTWPHCLMLCSSWPSWAQMKPKSQGLEDKRKGLGDPPRGVEKLSPLPLDQREIRDGMELAGKFLCLYRVSLEPRLLCTVCPAICSTQRVDVPTEWPTVIRQWNSGHTVMHHFAFVPHPFPASLPFLFSLCPGIWTCNKLLSFKSCLRLCF